MKLLRPTMESRLMKWQTSSHSHQHNKGGEWTREMMEEEQRIVSTLGFWEKGEWEGEGEEQEECEEEKILEEGE